MLIKSFLLMASSLVFTSAMASNNSYFSLETTTDNNDGKDHYVSAGLDFIKNSQLQLGFGKSESSTVKTDNYSIGIQSDPSAGFSIGVNYSFWQQKHEIDISTYQLNLNSYSDNWGIGVSPQLGIVTLYPLSAPPVDTNQTGLQFNIDYYGAYPWFFSAGFAFYSYDRNVSVLNINQYPFFTMRNFSTNTLNQATGLEDNHRSFDLGYDFSKLSLGFYHQKSESAVDNSIYTSNSIYGKLKLTDNWQVGIETGRSKNSITPGDSNTFSSFSINYNW